MDERFFPYGDEEIAYLKAKDEALAAVIDHIGQVNRPMDGDLFSSVVHHIVGQQISTAAQKTIWNRMAEGLGAVSAETVALASIEKLQSFGITFRKAGYIHDFATKVHTGAFNLDEVAHMADEDAIAALASLKGVGTWTAEMILLFCLGRPNVFAFDDLAIQRGLRMVYHHRKITKELFEKYRRRFTPYCSVASLYLWEVSHGAVPGLIDRAPKKTKR